MKEIDEMWKEKQSYLFALIKTKIPESQKFTDAIEEALGIGTDAVYRRISGKTILGAGELYVLCRKFDISMDKILNYDSGQDALLKSIVDPAADVGTVPYFQRLSGLLTELSRSAVDMEIVFTASDIPFYHFLNCPELLYFKLYIRHNTLNNIHIPYKDFCEQQDRDSIMPHCERMTDAYRQIPSKEIWSVHTVSTILQSLKYCAETGTFENKDTVRHLLKQLSELVHTVEKDARAGNRGHQKAPFSMYLSPVDFRNNIMLIRKGNKFSCDVQLFSAVSLFIEDEYVCTDIHRWINDFISKSMLVSGRLDRERCMFFQTVQDKINGLIDEIHSMTVIP
jgi:hypothetical protein